MPFDIGVGIFLAIYISHLFNEPLTLTLILLGIGAALLPDVDIMTMLWGRWRHREITHYPVVYIPIVALVYLVFGAPYGTLLVLGVLIHLLHDTVGIGWGISWLWPLTNRRFLFLPAAGRMKVFGLFMSWLPKDQQKIDEEMNARNANLKEDWITHYYLRPSLLGAIEYGMLVLSLLVLYQRLT
jgi:membrane-bound metal-dependent hydrolase YbcI (DUF457 family)